MTQAIFLNRPNRFIAEVDSYRDCGQDKIVIAAPYGIPEFNLIKAVGLDIDGADIDGIMKSAQESIMQL